MSYATNKQKAKFRNTEPTMTDQSAAKETDINVIVNTFARTGHVPGGRHPMPPGDFSNMPEDLRGFIETARSVARLKNQLPRELRDLAPEELLALTPEQLRAKLTPPTPTPAPTPAPTPEGTNK